MKIPPLLRTALSALLTAVLLSSCGIIVPTRRPDPDAQTDPSDTSSGHAGTAESAPDKAESTARPQVETTAVPAEKEADRLLKKLSTGKLDGVAVIVAGDTTPLSLEDTAASARAWRNATVEQRLNTHLLSTQADAASLLEDARQAVSADAYYADLLLIPANALGSFVSQKLLMNLSSLPFTDFDMCYFNASSAQEMTIGYQTYGISGAFTESPADQYLIAYNRDLAESLALPDFYQLYEDGAWCWDSLLSALKVLEDDLNGSAGVSTALSKDLSADLVFTSSGLHYMTTGRGALPALQYDEAQMPTLIETAHRLLTTESTYFDRSGVGENGVSEAAAAFMDGSALFFIGTAAELNLFRDLKLNWGILPIPKLSAQQSSYVTYCRDSAPVMAVLSGASDVDTSGILLQALNAASYRVIREAYTNHLRDYVLRDNGSLNVLQTVTDSYTFSFAHIFGDAVRSLEDGTFKLFRSRARSGAELGDTGYLQKQIAASLEKNFPIIE